MSGVFDGDQPTVAGAVVGATDTEMTVAQVQALATSLGEAPAYVFSANYTTIFNGQMLAFRYGVPYQLDPAILAFLTAAGAPMVVA